jgi:hypothetical protein
MARISKEWLDSHPNGDFPAGVEHMRCEDVWLGADRQATAADRAAR